MIEIKQIIHRELSGVLPVYLIKDIAQRIDKALNLAIDQTVFLAKKEAEAKMKEGVQE